MHPIDGPDRSGAGSVDLSWIPLGAGDTHCVRANGRGFEWLSARRQHRSTSALYHSALDVNLGARRFTIEMTTAWADSIDIRGRAPFGLGPATTDPAGSFLLRPDSRRRSVRTQTNH